MCLHAFELIIGIAGIGLSDFAGEKEVAGGSQGFAVFVYGKDVRLVGPKDVKHVGVVRQRQPDKLGQPIDHDLPQAILVLLEVAQTQQETRRWNAHPAHVQVTVGAGRAKSLTAPHRL